ncbi:glutathione S-transferase [Pseudohalocynthiibacter aestuariivivens]|jgi:glutathione S-transferase|uniref:Glutathione S-transferase n=1 Tax=Pseudohalocynthiibacter aestuariivivens TaxID=1591409 RepID=A0ABV5JC75_9RHOB|nr:MULTISPECIES: glutathione S-transferase [Pseudohalocynthiibacter]MBS9715952.1 glutathione S-transferase [Pseudohalocynthiibacter aestuariivivens]MCK0102492.1 glutathione S-transferase [Pseudohalocynthiibacter sp. F2068]
MTYDLAIGDRAYSSWSLRGWLLFENFSLPYRLHIGRLYSDDLPNLLRDFAPSRTVPAIKLQDGTVVTDTLAMAEELASRHPEAGIWPKDPKARAIARRLAAEMHSSFGALREACPMNLRVAYSSFEPSEEVEADLERIALIWDTARAELGVDGPWLCGAYSAADVFFAPVAARVAGYGLRVSESAQAYVDAHLADPAFRRWRAMGLVDGPDQPFYKRDFTTCDWPGPRPVAAHSVALGTPENETCPYSGKPSTHLMEVSGRTFGFCNAFCRDKTVADPEAWPGFMEIYQS